ncbi:DUF6476 family protein [Algicella marina]|uniref:Uncharacterized protein n=1 Tax=Algicella marina TaxID=2683284 RepID=A0A6P1SXH3_9RHOB|nr:DUF6476 family protein [Algicella marina]QHQ33906.1 hypothetical protein GO499_01270 [Algicella marina]
MEEHDTAPSGPEPAPLRRLRLLVTVLTLTMIVGMLTITGLLAWRLSTAGQAELQPGPTLPENLPLPSGETLISYTQSPDYTVLITRDADGQERLHLLTKDNGEISETLVLQR